MKILIGGDHAGFALKSELLAYLSGVHEIIDRGPLSYDAGDDYPDYVVPLTREVAAGKAERGIVIGGSGQGEAMAANRIPGIRAAVYYGGPLDVVRLSREHNDSNILSLGARFLVGTQARQAVDLWLSTSFSNDARHVRRARKIDE